MQVTYAVLVEQKSQEEEGIVDPDRLASASYQITFLSCMEAGAEARGKQYSEAIAFVEEFTSSKSPCVARKEKWMENDGHHQTTLSPSTLPSHQPLLLIVWQRFLARKLVAQPIADADEIP